MGKVADYKRKGRKQQHNDAEEMKKIWENLVRQYGVNDAGRVVWRRSPDEMEKIRKSLRDQGKRFLTQAEVDLVLLKLHWALSKTTGGTNNIIELWKQQQRGKEFRPGRRKGAVKQRTKLMQRAVDSLSPCASRQDVIDWMIEICDKIPEEEWQEFQRDDDGTYWYSPERRSPQEEVNLRTLLNSISKYRFKKRPVSK